MNDAVVTHWEVRTERRSVRDALLRAYDELAQQLAAKSPTAMQFAKQATNLSLQGAYADGLAWAR